MLGKFFIIVIIFGVISITIPAQAESQLETVEISGARLSNTSGSLGDHINIGQQAQISANIKNNLDQSQGFVYIYQVKDEAGFVIKLEWISGLLSPGQSFNTGVSWNPETGGTYTVEIFVWDGLKDEERNALDNFETFEVIVS